MKGRVEEQNAHNKKKFTYLSRFTLTCAYSFPLKNFNSTKENKILDQISNSLLYFGLFLKVFEKCFRMKRISLKTKNLDQTLKRSIKFYAFIMKTYAFFNETLKIHFKFIYKIVIQLCVEKI
ncbi:hypothetical protein BpHYR1_013129 [Brachionus plicatilis]|uniref:Uncharacterized protein n=1 Tax=Brachionus plicatilis TaxID=10195 RepID=A0A3M7Q8A7_BRAPC|nr:hypothetical protein BpHYR1_013129 [Brachionus plicatilis]